MHRQPRPDTDGDTSGRSADCIGTQLGVPLGRSADCIGTQLGVPLGHALKGRVASSKYMINEGGMLVIRDKDARDSGQLLFFREKNA